MRCLCLLTGYVILLGACGKLRHETRLPQNESSPRVLGNDPGSHGQLPPSGLSSHGGIDSFQLSKGGFTVFGEEGLALNPLLIPAQGSDQMALFNSEASEGLLKFGMQFNHPERDGSTTTFICSDTYLFTEVNQRYLEYPFDNREAAIFLKQADGSRLQVGRYLPALDFGRTRFLTREDSLSFNRWIHPLLCEGDFAAVCRLELTATPLDSSRTVPGHRVRLALYLTGEEQPALAVETPAAGPYPSFQHFGCVY